MQMEVDAKMLAAIERQVSHEIEDFISEMNQEDVDNETLKSYIAGLTKLSKKQHTIERAKKELSKQFTEGEIELVTAYGFGVNTTRDGAYSYGVKTLLLDKEGPGSFVAWVAHPKTGETQQRENFENVSLAIEFLIPETEGEQ